MLMQSTITAPSVEFVEVFQTNRGSVFQSDKQNCWYVDFAGKLARFDYRSIMKLRKAIYAIDIEALLLSSELTPDLEIVFICACDHCYVLTLLEIIDFKQLLEGTFVMLELNRILHDRVYRLAI
jgi:hypothetical protein